MMAYLENARPECPHCTSDDTELQVATQTRETYLCNNCGKTFTRDKARRYEQKGERKR
jgi:transposase-like protein